MAVGSRHSQEGSHRQERPPRQEKRSGGEHGRPDSGSRRGVVAIVLALLLAAGAIGGSVAYGFDHRQHAAEKSPDPKPPDDSTAAAHDAKLPFSDDMHVKLGHPAELGGVLVTVRDVRCGKEIPADILNVWSHSEPGVQCIVDVSATTGGAPVNLLSNAQSLSDDQGHFYQVSRMQHLLSCDQIYDRSLDPRSRIENGCLLYTLPKHAKPAAVLLIHGPHSAVVEFKEQ
ncbi:MAG TPA: hypothetical protein VHC49_05335 [Mycobacteriales bacterium]|nr:hypothetical protein [Mycobacteriales bacterium]